MGKIFFNYQNKRYRIRNVRKIKYFINLIFENYNISIGRLDYILCSKEYLRDLNIQFLRKDYFTDTISFVLSKKGEALRGEVYISPAIVKNNACFYSESYYKEMVRVIFHGSFHLCGINDSTTQEFIQMKLLEETFLMNFENFKSFT